MVYVLVTLWKAIKFKNRCLRFINEWGLCLDLVLQWLMVHKIFDVLQGCRSNVCQCLACEKGWCEVTMTLLKDSSRAGYRHQ